MEKIYKKVGKRYVEAGYNTPDLVDGIWLIQTKKHSRSLSNLVFRIGDLQSPRDIVTQGAMLSMQDELTRYIVSIGDENSQEFKDVKARLGGWVKRPIEIYNISPSDLSYLILNKISENLERTEKTEWARLMLDFRQCSNNKGGIKRTPEGALWDFTEWLEENGYELKQIKR